MGRREHGVNDGQRVIRPTRLNIAPSAFIAPGAVLVGAASPAAGITEIHEMKMDGGVMSMRAIPRLELPAGKPVQLGPGGYHVMLINLKQPLKKGDSVPLTLQVEGKDKKVETIQIKAEVRDLTSVASPASEHKH